jgi:dihydrofolate reductase
MQKPRISIIAAIGKNRELGKNSQLLWRISSDLKRVKELTTGHPIIMGRKTYDSIGRPLPNRTNIVVSRAALCIEGCLVFDSLEKAVAAATAIDSEEIFIFGGGTLYAQALSFTDRLYLTIIDAEDPEADTFFPDFSEFTHRVSEEYFLEHIPPYSYTILEKE